MFKIIFNYFIIAILLIFPTFAQATDLENNLDQIQYKIEILKKEMESFSLNGDNLPNIEDITNLPSIHIESNEPIDIEYQETIIEDLPAETENMSPTTIQKEGDYAFGTTILEEPEKKADDDSPPIQTKKLDLSECKQYMDQLCPSLNQKPVMMDASS